MACYFTRKSHAVGYDVSEVFTHLLVAPSRHVAVVDRTSTTQPPPRESDGPRCVECAASVIGPVSNPPSQAREGLKKNTVEQWLPYENYAVDQGLPYVKNAVEQRLPLENATVEQRLPFANASVAQQDLRDTGMVETELPCLEEGEVSSSESSSSETSASSSGSRRLRKSKSNRSGRRRLRRRSTAVDQAPSSEIRNVVEYSEGSPNQVRAIEVANPPTDAATITQLPGLSWKHFLRDLKAATTPRRRDRRRLSRSPFARHASLRSLGKPSKTRTTPSTRLHASSKTSSPRRFRRNFLLSEASGTRSTSCPGRSTA
ncbi:hypothetical protein PR002_g31403 [Phytophthora rubi]|uniref:Uncharacterized protein n=1 Tax=Phytophthora rubi TaxID=129364 RepID=A0A6A3GDC9_9STRA|nr:hypothetical protein PR002_g31403 [Phytophthora rubi]